MRPDHITYQVLLKHHQTLSPPNTLTCKTADKIETDTRSNKIETILTKNQGCC